MDTITLFLKHKYRYIPPKYVGHNGWLALAIGGPLMIAILTYGYGPIIKSIDNIRPIRYVYITNIVEKAPGFDLVPGPKVTFATNYLSVTIREGANLTNTIQYGLYDSTNYFELKRFNTKFYPHE